MRENELAKLVVDAAYHIHTHLGPGLMETVYEVILAYQLQEAGLHVARQKPVPIQWGNIRFEEGFRADLIVDDLLIVELKSVEKLHPAAGKQLLTYLRLMDLKLGLLINFGEAQIKNGIKRIVNGL